MADEKKHTHQCTHCCEGCVAHREAEREDLREKLKRCGEAREAARVQKEQEMQQALEAHEEELSSLKKKLLAFQLATVVGVTILGQETFDKIMGKVGEAQAVTEKITGGGKAEDSKDTKAAAPKSGKPLSWGGNSSIGGSYTPISDLWKIEQRRVPSQMDAPITITEPLTPVTVAAGSPTDTGGIGLPPITLPPNTPWARNDWSEYIFTNPTPDITPVVVAWNAGVEADWGDGAGVFVQPSVVPSPNTFSVFALSLINNGRRRIA